MKGTFKKAISLALCALLTISAFTAFTAYAEGETDPILIHNLEELKSIENDMSGNYALANSIVLDADVPFVSLGTSSNPFKGHFDGNGFTIKNLNLTYTAATNSAYVGLFSYNNGIIENLLLENVTASVGSYKYLNIGAFAGQNVINRKLVPSGGKILNCYASGSFTNLSATIYARIGGIVGNVSNGTVNNCVSNMNIDFNGTCSVDVGGISSSNGGIIYNCGNTGDLKILTTCSATVGGIAGVATGTATSPSTLQDCFNSGDITAESNESLLVGGICGKLEINSSSNIVYTCNAGKITATGHFSSGFNPDLETMAYGAIVGSYGSKGSNNYYVSGTYSKGIGKAATGNELTAEEKTVEEIRAMDWDAAIWYLPSDSSMIPQIKAYKNVVGVELSSDEQTDVNFINGEYKLTLIASYDDGTSGAVKPVISAEDYQGSSKITYGYKNASGSYIVGDVNADTGITVSDVIQIRSGILTSNKLSGTKFFAADVDHNRAITVTDIVGTINIICG